MDINTDRVIIKGGAEAAVFYGIQISSQSTSHHQWSNVGLPLPAGTINNWPEFSYRRIPGGCGQTLLLCRLPEGSHRHAGPAQHQLFPLASETEDQGWRIEIKKYPELDRNQLSPQGNSLWLRVQISSTILLSADITPRKKPKKSSDMQRYAISPSSPK